MATRKTPIFSPLQAINYHISQTFTFKPVVDPENFAGLVDLRLRVQGKKPRPGDYPGFFTSTRTWHDFPIDTLSSNDQLINSIIDITNAVETLEDFTEVQIRFVYSRNEGGKRQRSIWSAYAWRS